MTLVAIKHINPNERLKWMASLKKYRKKHIELHEGKTIECTRDYKIRTWSITNMQTCKIKWIKTIRNKNVRTYWIWNEGDKNKNLPNITLIKRKTITWGDRKEKKNAQQMFWQQSFKGMIMHT